MFKEGRAEGKTEKAFAIAKALRQCLKRGDPVDKIVRITGLSATQIEQLKQVDEIL